MKNKTMALLFTFLSCAHYSSGEKYKLTEDISYKNNPEKINTLGDLYVSENPNADLVITVHGGGWSSRNKGDMAHVARSLATNGFHVFNINYRLSPEFRHPAPLDDLAEAIKFLKANKEKLNLNFSRISLWGYSSGGHTVSLFSLLNPGLIYKVVSGGAPYDFTWYPESPYIKLYLGEFRDKMYKQYFDASPVNHITKDAPPFYLYHSTSDTLVEYVQATNFESLLNQKDVPVVLNTVSFLGHANTFLFSRESIKNGVKFLKEAKI